jgi:hypothetical protein
MDKFFHRFSELFAQLGLPNGEADIRAFIEQHSPLNDTVHLHEAPFWTSAQAALLREQLLVDADWAEVIDQLNLALRARFPS